MTTCTLCAEIAAKNRRAPWNEFIIETENFGVIPSLGALVEGWVLMIPKAHYISFGALPRHLREEADVLRNRVRALLESRYENRIVEFEHGPSAAEHGTGCGVDHAHLHLVPLNCDLKRFVAPFVPSNLDWMSCDWNTRTKAYETGLDYLYLRVEGVGEEIAVTEDFGSQVFRRAISAYLGNPNEYSWRDYPRLDVVGRTMEGLRIIVPSFEAIGAENAA